MECATDTDGVVVNALPDSLDALLVTPSHLYPFGGAMPAARRVELLEWAARTDTVVIEDDFNTELRYRISPQPALSSLATRADVLTLGTFFHAALPRARRRLRRGLASDRRGFARGPQRLGHAGFLRHPASDRALA